ncbi:hypothetical protein [Sphingobacterium mizutaii]|nr:hypothetical protein [Sphingobacterium mizutaii]
MKSYLFYVAFGLTLTACNNHTSNNNNLNSSIQDSVISDSNYTIVKDMAKDIVKSGFNAGDGYQEVWIRDYNTFIRLAYEVQPVDQIKKNLLAFFGLQAKDGNIPDGFVTKESLKGKTSDYYSILSKLEPLLAAHKNTVETDQEASLIQAVYKYIQVSDDRDFLKTMVGQFTVAQRMEQALQFLMDKRFDKEHGLLWGATTVDWGDVQPEHDWGVHLDDNSHLAIDIYDNAMFLIALDNFMVLVPDNKPKWETIRKDIATNTMKHLWDAKNQKFIPHIYLNGSPFPADFDENKIFYHGGTAIAIEANLLSKEQIKTSLDKMIANVKESGAATIGLTIYPTYPKGFFKNKGMYPYGYQNGGDWT